ncbi:unnamed protein product [Rhodiola kirilowii]
MKLYGVSCSGIESNRGRTSILSERNYSPAKRFQPLW